MEEAVILMCGLVGTVRPVHGSVKGMCDICHRAVWIAPTGIAIVKERNARILCVPHGLRSVVESGGDVEGLTPEQIKEIRGEQQRERDIRRSN